MCQGLPSHLIEGGVRGPSTDCSNYATWQHATRTRAIQAQLWREQRHIVWGKWEIGMGMGKRLEMGNGMEMDWAGGDVPP